MENYLGVMISRRFMAGLVQAVVGFLSEVRVDLVPGIGVQPLMTMNMPVLPTLVASNGKTDT